MENKFAVISEMEMYEINGGVYPKDAGTSGLMLNPLSFVDSSASGVKIVFNEVATGFNTSKDSGTSGESQRKEQLEIKRSSKSSSSSSGKSSK